MIAKIEPISRHDCRVHMKAPAPDNTGGGGPKKDTHNVIEVSLPADELRHAIAEMSDGDVYDPLNLEMVGAE